MKDLQNSLSIKKNIRFSEKKGMHYRSYSVKGLRRQERLTFFETKEVDPKHTLPNWCFEKTRGLDKVEDKVGALATILLNVLTSGNASLRFFYHCDTGN